MFRLWASVSMTKQHPMSVPFIPKREFRLNITLLDRDIGIVIT
jgi:hypothetical protein